MPLHPGFGDIVLRLVATLVAGGVIGLDRETRGEKAGFRTNMLVALAAAVAMIQANLLLPVDGKTGASFSVMDVMRLPLGILTGVGFIGAGAILRRGELVIGVTTAATLWTMTVIGLCFGGGQYVLGACATLLAAGIVWLLKAVDRRFSHVQRATLRITGRPGPGLRGLVEGSVPPAFRLTLLDVLLRHDAEEGSLVYQVEWSDTHREDTPDAMLAALRSRPGVTLVAWRAMTRRG